MTVLISKHDQMYPERDSEAPEGCVEVKSEDQQQQQPNLVGWISEEDLQSLTHAGKSSTASDNPTSSSASSLDGSPGGPCSKSGTQGKGEAVVSPSKQAKALPSWKYTFKSSSPRPQPAKVSGSSVDVSNASGGNWLMNGLSSLRGHRRTSAGERVRDSGSSQRLSTYDNVTLSSSMGSAPSVDSAPWSTSSCEISIPESGSDPSEAESRKECWAELEENPQTVEARTVEREDAAEDYASRTCCVDNSNVVPLITVMDEDTEESPSSLASLVAALREELMRQKQAYESRIKK